MVSFLKKLAIQLNPFVYNDILTRSLSAYDLLSEWTPVQTNGNLALNSTWLVPPSRLVSSKTNCSHLEDMMVRMSQFKLNFN